MYYSDKYVYTNDVLIQVSRPGVFHAVYIVVDKVTEAVLSQVSLFQPEVSTKVIIYFTLTVVRDPR